MKRTTTMRHTLTSAALLLGTIVLAQTQLQRLVQQDTMPNMVPNPGFEITERTLCRWTQDVAKFNQWMGGWTSPTQTTPDHFSMNNDRDCWSHPLKKSDGKSTPHGGANMMGIKTYGKGNTPTYWHEYLQMELPEPLVPGTRYVAEVYVQRAPDCNEATNNIGILLSDSMVNNRDRLPLYITPTVNESKVIDKRGWHKVSGVFDARTASKFILIGNFYRDEATQHERQADGEKGGYYFIDDVNIRLAPDGATLTAPPPHSAPPTPKVKITENASTKEIDLHVVEPEVGKNIRLDNIFFDFDKATIQETSNPELTRIVDLLTDYPFMRIEIEGHTDSEGADDYNMKLSEKRAKAIVDHLINEKIDKERMSWKGYGETRPITGNDTEAGRSKNRRVEMRILDR